MNLQGFSELPCF